MSSIIEVIKTIHQPNDGYLPVNKFKEIQLNDDLEVTDKENIPLHIVGVVIDYMTRFMMIGDAKNCFRVSLTGAMMVDEIDNASVLLESITGLNDQSIIAACKLVGYDVCFRQSPNAFVPVEQINPDPQTIENIKVMINRSVLFISEYGPIIKEGITFEGGYTNKITMGDGDFLTKGIMWDIKLSPEGIDTTNTLQLLIHYLMGKRSNYPELQEIYKIGFFNPRLNKIYLLDTNTLDEEMISKVEVNVIGYDPKEK